MDGASTLAVSAVTAVCAFVLTWAVVPKFMSVFAKAGLHGVDLNKQGTEPVPEALGLVSAIVYLMATSSCLALISDATDRIRLTASLASVAFMTILGFVDDVLELRWRYKLVLPVFAALPAISAYDGDREVCVPSFLAGLMSYVSTPLSSMDGLACVRLNWVYNIVLSLFALYCGNGINIYAGINGLEVGQSLVATCSLALYAMGANNARTVALALPHIATSLALLAYNRYPSRCFVGDTYTYTSGMILFVLALDADCPLHLLCFMWPELLNFLISLPQLLGILPCPRHRLPVFDPQTGKLHARQGQWTLINAYLRLRGPLDERRLCLELLGLQALGTAALV